MKTGVIILLSAIFFLSSCNGSNSKATSFSTGSTSVNNKESNYPYVTAKINGKEWHSIKDEILMWALTIAYVKVPEVMV
ncbi:MAG: hypothetical protein IPL84_00055 [Chitinophagaceae bacterium]|nr:hypothetical protein [Chitinophagaceae bacterium]